MWYVRRQALATEDAAAEARRAADAAGEAVSYKREEAEQNRVDFRLVRTHGKGGYVLRNDGTHPAYGVHIDADGLVVRGSLDVDEFPDGHAEELLLYHEDGE